MWQIHIVCTERLTGDLEDLVNRTFGVADFRAAHLGARSRQFARSAAPTLSAAPRATLDVESPALRRFVNYEIAPVDTALHERFCAGRGVFGGVPADLRAHAATATQKAMMRPIERFNSQLAAIAARGRFPGGAPAVEDPPERPPAGGVRGGGRRWHIGRGGRGGHALAVRHNGPRGCGLQSGRATKTKREAAVRNNARC